MNPILKIVIDALFKYLQEHPEDVQKLIEIFVKWIISQNPPPTTK